MLAVQGGRSSGHSTSEPSTLLSEDADTSSLSALAGSRCPTCVARHHRALILAWRVVGVGRLAPVFRYRCYYRHAVLAGQRFTLDISQSLKPSLIWLVGITPNSALDGHSADNGSCGHAPPHGWMIRQDSDVTGR
nr:unnamed protein product [Spirometra erinaceieuropaei]